MSITVVRCSLDGCREPAAYKIAALWSDGRFSEGGGIKRRVVAPMQDGTAAVAAAEIAGLRWRPWSLPLLGLTDTVGIAAEVKAEAGRRKTIGMGARTPGRSGESSMVFPAARHCWSSVR